MFSDLKSTLEPPLKNDSFSLIEIFRHIIAFSYVLVLGYLILLHEYSDRAFFYFYFIPYQPLLTQLNSVLIVPLNFLIIFFVFLGIFYLSKIENNFKSLFRKHLLFSLIVYFFFLILTLFKDTSFYISVHPIGYPEIFFKAIYAHLAATLLLVFANVALILCLLQGNQILGNFKTFIIILPIQPFIFQWNVVSYFISICLAVFIVFAFQETITKITKSGYFSASKTPWFFLSVIVLVAIVFRIWTLNYVIQENLALTITDGEGYYENSIDLWNGKPVRMPTTVPSYSYLLMLFYKLVGFKLENVLYISAVICSLTPLPIFFIGKTLFGTTAGLIGAICVALSEHHIHYSTILHRNGLSSFFLSIAIAFLIKQNQSYKLRDSLYFGFFMGWSVLLDGILAPILGLGIIPFLNSKKIKIISKNIALIILGFLLAQAPFNWRMYQDLGKVYPLGRDMAAVNSQWNYGQHPEGEVLRAMGFDPFKDLGRSIEVIIASPIKTTSLFLQKSAKEFQNYFLDRQEIYIDPVSLNRETYFSSSIRFLYFPILLFGTLFLIFSKTLKSSSKLILTIPIAFPMIFHCLFSMGTNRYRIVTQPLILVLFALGLFQIIKYFFKPNNGEIRTGDQNKNSQWLSPNKKLFSQKNYFAQRFIQITCVIAIFSVLIWKAYQSQKFLKDEKKVPISFTQRDWTVGQSIFKPQIRTLNKKFIVLKPGYYNALIQIAYNFGVKVQLDLQFYLNGNLVKTFQESGFPENILLQNIKLNKGMNEIFIKPISHRTKKDFEKSKLHALGKNVLSKSEFTLRKLRLFKLNNQN